MSGDDQGKRTFADKLKHLRATVHPSDRGPYSYREIANAIQGKPGEMSAQYLQQLETGKRGSQPKIHYVETLAEFFGVRPEYFFDDDYAQRVDAQMDDIVAWRDEETRQIAQRFAGLSPRDRAAVSSLIDSLSAYEQEPRESRRRRKSAPDKE